MSSANRAGGHGARRRPKGGHEEEHENTERWLLSYVDMVTVLMALFIVLFAISQVDKAKFSQLAASLSVSFGTPATTILDGGQGAMTGGTSAKPDAIDLASDAGLKAGTAAVGTTGATGAATTAPDSSGVDPAVLAAAKAEVAHLDSLQAAITAKLNELGLADRVRFRMDERGLILGLVADDVFFASGSADLTPTAREVLDGAGPVLAGIKEQISVEGHANVLPISGRYATNWELSSDRATQVLRQLVENDAVGAERIMAVGFGDARPLVDGTSPEALTANRRVDLVILSSAPEQVRALLPALENAGG